MPPPKKAAKSRSPTERVLKFVVQRAIPVMTPMNAKVVKKEGNFMTVTKKPFINPAKLQAKSASNADKIQ